MTSITRLDMETLLTTMYVLIDDWYQEQGQGLLQGKTGAKAAFSDSELLTLILARDYLPYPGETQYVGWLKANYGQMFPKLVDQSQFNRRGRALQQVLEALRRYWTDQLGASWCDCLLLDTKPVPVVGYTRSKAHSDFAGRASYGYCAARKLHYFGFKLVLWTTTDGVPVAYDLVPANTDERIAAQTVLDQVADCDILGDKGFLGTDWQQAVAYDTGNCVFTPKRANQSCQNAPALDARLHALRERIEGVFHQVQNTGLHLEHLRARTVFGLTARVTLKVTALVLKHLLVRDFGFDIQAFSISH
jgi:transposase